MMQAHLDGQLLLMDRSGYNTEVKSYTSRHELWYDLLVHISTSDILTAGCTRVINLTDEELKRFERIMADELNERAKRRVLNSNL